MTASGQLEVLAYVIDALRRQEHRHRSNHWPVPAGVAALVDEIGFRVSRGQDGSADAPPSHNGQSRDQPRVMVRYETAAQMLEVSVSTVKRLVGQGCLSAVKVNGASRIRVADLESYAASLPTIQESA